MSDKFLILGASGQIGTELVLTLRNQYGANNVVATDIKASTDEVKQGGPFELLDVLDYAALNTIIKKYGITQIYHLVALLSATSEQKQLKAWQLNMDSLFNVMELCLINNVSKLFWPSSIAVFGPTTPKANVPQHTIIEPTTVYGISKMAGENWAAYYHAKKGLDVRSIRYAGLIGYNSLPGGGTTDYAVDIFYKAKAMQDYTCFLEANTRLPMMYITDAINATLQLMDAPANKLSTRAGYNLAGIDFTPAELANEIKKHIPSFNIAYEPDFRQHIANSWPGSIDGSVATLDWGWQPKYNMAQMVTEMLHNVKV
jgi:nucleoside-diphosphate-sugar epimerase